LPKIYHGKSAYNILGDRVPRAETIFGLLACRIASERNPMRADNDPVAACMLERYVFTYLDRTKRDKVINIAKDLDTILSSKFAATSIP